MFTCNHMLHLTSSSETWGGVMESGPLHMSLVLNPAGPVGKTNFVFCSYGKFNPGYQGEKCPKGPQNTFGTMLQQHYKTCAVKNVSSRTVPVYGLECSYGKKKNFQLVYRDLGRKNQDLGNRASPPPHMNTSKFL